MTLVDTSVWVDFLRGAQTAQTEVLDQLLGDQEVAIGDLIVLEVLQGIRKDREFNQTREMLATLETVELGGTDLAVKAAKNFRRLRELGITVRKTIDTLIATRCIENGYALLHNDRDFDPFVKHLGLRVAGRTH